MVTTWNIIDSLFSHGIFLKYSHIFVKYSQHIMWMRWLLHRALGILTVPLLALQWPRWDHLQVKRYFSNLQTDFFQLATRFLSEGNQISFISASRFLSVGYQRSFSFAIRFLSSVGLLTSCSFLCLSCPLPWTCPRITQVFISHSQSWETQKRKFSPIKAGRARVPRESSCSKSPDGCWQ